MSDVVTAIVESSSKNGIYVYVGNRDFPILIKKNHLANEIENARPSRFAKGDKVDAMIIELNKNERKISLSIKALEEQQTKETVKKYGSKDSGALLGEILGPLLKKNKPNSKLEIFKDCSHNVHLEETQKFNETVKNFLE